MYHYMILIRLSLHNQLVKTWRPYCLSRCSASNTAHCRHSLRLGYGQMRTQAMFAATLLCLFSLGPRLSVSVNQSEVIHRFLSEVFNFKM